MQQTRSMLRAAIVPSLSHAPIYSPATIERRQSRNQQPEVRVRSVTGFDRGLGKFPRQLSDQCRQALLNGAESLAAAGLSMGDVVQITYLVHDADGFPGCFAMLRDAFGDARPASTLRLVGGFNRPDVKIELELTARRLPCGNHFRPGFTAVSMP